MVLMMHDNGGDEFKGNTTTPTHVWLRDCEIQIKANEHQKVSISREEGLLVVHFWTTGFADLCGPDYKVVITPMGCHPRIEIEECINDNL
jgi:hypothetical protein